MFLRFVVCRQFFSAFLPFLFTSRRRCRRRQREEEHDGKPKTKAALLLRKKPNSAPDFCVNSLRPGSRNNFYDLKLILKHIIWIHFMMHSFITTSDTCVERERAVASDVLCSLPAFYVCLMLRMYMAFN